MIFKKLLQGLIIGLVPGIVSLFFWNFSLLVPRVSTLWFAAIILVATTVGLAIALRMWFIEEVDRRYTATQEAVKTGLTWYVELLVLYFIFAIVILKNPMHVFYPAIVLLLTIVIHTTIIGSIIDKRKQKLTTTSYQNEQKPKSKK